jgi:hypothetical protein
VDEMLQHLFGDSEICDHAVLQWADGGDVAGGTSQHQLGLGAHGGDALGTTRATVLANRHYGRLVQNDPLATHVNQCVGSSKINREVVGKQAK